MSTSHEYPTNPPEVEILDGPSYEGGIDDGGPHHTYRLSLIYDGRVMETPWSQGLGITDDPSIGGVMSCLISDAAGKFQTHELERVIGRRILVALMDDEDSTYGSDERFLAAWERVMAQVAA